MHLVCLPCQLGKPCVRSSACSALSHMRAGATNHSSPAVVYWLQHQSVKLCCRCRSGACSSRESSCLCWQCQAVDILFLALHAFLCRLSSACPSAAALGTRPSMPPQQQEPTCWGATGTRMHHSLKEQSAHDNLELESLMLPFHSEMDCK